MSEPGPSAPRDAEVSTHPSAPSGAGADRVELRMPAMGAYLSVLRTAVAGLAARLDFTLEEIEDLRIAVDEACALLLFEAVPGSQLDCCFELSGDRLRLRVTATTASSNLPSRDTFAWTVLSALAGGVDAYVEGDGRVTIELHKTRAGAGRSEGAR